MRLAACVGVSGFLIGRALSLSLPLPLFVAAAAVLACEPTPRYATPEEPLVGKVALEASTVVTDAGGELDFFYADWLPAYRLRVSIPAGAYPKGTVVTIRLLSELDTRADTEIVLGRFLNGGNANIQALQLLPASLTPAVPVHVAIVGALNPWTFDVLHARETAPAWTVVTSVAPSTTDVTTLPFDMDAPGLWTIGQLPLPASLQGHLQRVQLACGDVPVSAPRVRTVDFVRNSYHWSSPAGPGCDQVDSGTIQAAYSPDCVDFSPNFGVGGTACFVLDGAGTGLSLSWLVYGGPSNECPGTTVETEQYVLMPAASVDAGASQTDGSCPPDAGGGSDGGRG